MYDFIVLGLIPGTDIRIGFWPMLGLMAVSVIIFKIYKPRLVKIISGWWHQYDDIQDMAHRPLHARRLHRRMAKPAR